MADDQKKSELSNSNAKWQKESAKIRNVQISLDFPDTADILLRTLAARQHKAPSSLVREILGMPSGPPKRARIGVSFNDDELAELGKRYSIDSHDRAEIRRRVTEEVTTLLASTGGTLPKVDNDVDSDPASSSKAEKQDGSIDLKVASDEIYRRFQNALEKRNSK